MEQMQMSPAQIKKYLKQLRERQDQYLYYLGQLVCQAADEGRIEEAGILEAHKTLKEIQAQIAQWESALQEMKAAREAARAPKCPYCGAAVARGAVFCPGCGTALAAAPAAAPAPAAYGTPAAAPAQVAPGAYGAPAAASGKACPSCGAAMDYDALFCGECGTRIIGSPATAAEPAAVPPVEAAAPASQAAVEAVEAPAEDAAPEAPTEAAPAVAEAESPGTAPVRMEPSMPAAAEAPASPEASCPTCGTKVSDPEAVFCPECGTRLR